MTHDETRDELARMDGKTFVNGKWYGCEPWPNHGYDDHPHPPTLDGANAAVPEGWEWGKGRQAKFGGDGYVWAWWAERKSDLLVVPVPDTGNPMDDLYALALACRRAMEERK